MKYTTTLLLQLYMLVFQSAGFAQNFNKISLDFGMATFYKEHLAVGHTFLLQNSQQTSKYTYNNIGLNGFGLSLGLEKGVNKWLSVAAIFQGIGATKTGSEWIGGLYLNNGEIAANFPYQQELRTKMAGPTAYFHLLKKENMDLKLGIGYFFEYSKFTYSSHTTLIFKNSSDSTLYEQTIKTVKEKDTGTSISLGYGLNIYKNLDLHCQGLAVFMNKHSYIVGTLGLGMKFSGGRAAK